MKILLLTSVLMACRNEDDKTQGVDDVAPVVVDADGDGVGANADLDDNNANVGLVPDAVMTITDTAIELGMTGTVYLEVTGAEGFNALDASLTYDPTILELVSVTPEAALSEWHAKLNYSTEM